MEDDLMLRQDPMTSEEANARIKKLRKYKLPDGVVPPGISLKEFVEKFMLNWCFLYHTYYAHNNEIQCAAGKRRSLGDITRLAQNYVNSNTSLEEVKNILKDLLNEGKLDTLICQMIKKRVFFIRPVGSQYKHIDEPDEFGWIFNLDKKTKVPKKYQLV